MVGASLYGQCELTLYIWKRKVKMSKNKLYFMIVTKLACLLILISMWTNFNMYEWLFKVIVGR